ncbi:hypothetical protein [Leeia aquatica]|uniref:Lipoprotein n=1 Tax=Leeia aquatica TaxID=2725557 RepID=A0A847SEI4_9NEIS|nr:hypothetical protein [Leeia aquatica]NLR74362.1 hypothetical protein [Leeia aquatica]
MPSQRTVSILLAFILATVLTACGNISNVRAFNRNYQEPTEGDRAQLRVSVQGGMVRGVPGKDCIDWGVPESGVIAITMGGFADPKRSPIPMPAPSATTKQFRSAGRFEEAEVYIPAGKPMTLDYLSSGGRYQCFVHQSFLPERDANYEALFRLNGSSCEFLVLKISEGPLGVTMQEKVPLSKASLCSVWDVL